MHHVYAKPLKFSDHHGCNVVIKSNRTLSEAKYLKAHGQFITKRPIRREQRFDMVFQGKGIVKFNAFPHKSQAVDWVRSKQPLPSGCRRVKLNGIVQYTVSVPNPGRCVLVESVRQSGRELFTFEAGPSTTLGFDIECGDIMVHIEEPSSNLTFDTFCHSPHIDISRTQRRSTALLRHYNPSSLCCLEDAPLIPGVVFRLEVENSCRSLDSGSYIRVCVDKQLTPYENNGQMACCGSPTHPCVKGRRRLISHNSYEVFIVRILHNGLSISRPHSRSQETLRFLVGYNKTLWFEMHKVSLRAWKVCERDVVDLGNSFITFEIDLDDSPPSEPAPPPPLFSLGAPTTCQRHADRNTKLMHRRHHLQPMLAGIHHSGYLSETSTSDVCAANPSTLDREYATYVSIDNFSSSHYHNSAICPECAAVAISLASNGTMKHDLLCDNYIDTTPLPSIGPNLITLSSSESLNGHSNSQNENITNARHKPHYEQPGHIWEMSKYSTQTPFSNSKNIREKNTVPPQSNVSRNCRLCAHRSEEGKFNVNKSNLCEQNQHNDTHTDNSTYPGLAEVTPQCRDHNTTAATNNYSSDIDRNQMCELWVAKVNDNQDVWTTQEDVDRKIGSQDCQSPQEHRGRHMCGSANAVYPAICNSEVNRRVNASEIPTSSVWLSDLDTGLESVQHNLDIHFVPVQGQLKCHSYYSDTRNTFVDSINNPADPLNIRTDIRNTHAGSRKSLTEVINSPARFSHVLNDARNSVAGQRKSLMSMSSLPVSCLSKNILCSNNQETTLKKTFCDSTVSLFDSNSTFVNSETRPKSFCSDDSVSADSVDSLDETTLLKHLAVRENVDIVHAERHSPESDLTYKASHSLPPKLCSQQPVSQYCLAKPLSPVPVTGFSRSLSESTRNQARREFTRQYEINYNGDDEESCEDSAETSNEALTVTNGSDRENELSEHAIDSDSGVICMRNHLRHSRRNITESIISNSAAAYLTMGPTVQLPTGTQPMKRSETLKRNLDSSPLNKSFK